VAMGTRYTGNTFGRSGGRRRPSTVAVVATWCAHGHQQSFLRLAEPSAWC